MNSSLFFGFVIFATLLVAVIFLGASFYSRYLRISRGKAALLWLAALSASVVIFACVSNGLPWNGFGDRYSDFPPGRTLRLLAQSNGEHLLALFFACLLPLAAIPFLAKLYLTWIAGGATDAEKAPGMQGIRAWLRGGNLFCAILITLGLGIGFRVPFLIPTTLVLMALLAFPVLHMVTDTSSPQPTVPAGDTLAPERERVLKMLDDGKITAQESAELLNALAHSAPARPPQPAPVPSAPRKMVWLGAALLVIGFFLPWFEAGNQNMSAYIAGGDIAHGFGWCILFLGIAVAVLPVVDASLDSQTCQKISVIALGVGAIILLYLFTRNFRFVSIGILLVLAGYALEFIGVLKSRKLDWLRAS
jgi:hypothetical protein